MRKPDVLELLRGSNPMERPDQVSEVFGGDASQTLLEAVVARKEGRSVILPERLREPSVDLPAQTETPTLQPPPARPRRRRSLLAIAAVVTIVLVGLAALVLTTLREDRPVVDQPLPTTLLPGNEPIDLARQFWEAVAEGDTARLEGFDFAAAPGNSQLALENLVYFLASFRWGGEVIKCEETVNGFTGINVVCTLRLDHPLVGPGFTGRAMIGIVDGSISGLADPSLLIVRHGDLAAWARQEYPAQFEAVCDPSGYPTSELHGFSHPYDSPPDYAPHPNCGAYLKTLVDEYVAATPES